MRTILATSACATTYAVTVNRFLKLRASSWSVVAFAALLAAATVHAAGPFRPPTPNAAPFQREALAIDLDTMSSLARGLTALGIEAGSGERSSKRRAGAQLLALAEVLDPNPSAVREHLKHIAAGKPPTTPPAPQLAAARARAWQVWQWLSSDAAGPVSRNFAACLGDALATIDPTHPKASALQQKGEQGQWSGWVAEVAAFRNNPSNNPDPDPDPPSHTANPPTQDHSATPPAVTTPRIFLKEASVATALYYYDSSNQKMVSRRVPVKMTAWIDSEGGSEHFSFRVAGVEDMQRLAASRDHLLAALKDLRGGLPAKGRASFSFGEGVSYSTQWNLDTVSGPAAVLLNAAITGQAPAKDLAVLGIIGSQGKFLLPNRPWERLRILEQESSGRLLVPKEAADFLVGMLVLEKPEFFIHHEVLAAANLAELAARAGQPEPGPLADAMAKFDEIRRVGQGKPVPQFVAHPSTRQRLAEILQLCPDHLSARMLLLQGSGTRPVKFSAAILAREIRRALKPMAWAAPGSSTEWTTDKLDSTHEACRKELDALATKVDIKERPLHDEAVALVNNLRTIARNLRRANSDPNGGWDFRQRNVSPQMQQTKSDYGTLMEKLDTLTGEDEYHPPSG